MSNVIHLDDYRKKKTEKEYTRKDLIACSDELFARWLARQPESEHAELIARRSVLRAAMKMKW